MAALESGPLSLREIFVQVTRVNEGTDMSRRAFEMLVAAGRVRRHGCRVSFDHGHEVVFSIERNCPLNRHEIDSPIKRRMLVND